MIIGHQKQQEFLKRVVETGRLPHAFLFSGVESLGKKTVAFKFLESLNCKKFSKQSPDLLVVAPEREIAISQIREVRSFLSLKPFSAPFKQVVIDQAEKMKKDAQNCLLKTLEEPPDNSLIILISATPDMLFKTIRSRCQILKFYPLSEDELRLFLKDKARCAAELEKIIFFAEGRPGRALRFLEKPQMLDVYQAMLRRIGEIACSPLTFRFQYLKKFFNQDSEQKKLKLFLQLLFKYFRTLFLLKLKKTSPPFLFDSIFLNSLQSFCLLKIKKILEELEQAQFLIFQTNINKKLVLENLFLKI